MMKSPLIFALILFYASSVMATTRKSLVCRDADFGAGHLKFTIADLSPFLAPREQGPSVSGTFWVKGERFTGVFESPIFMPDWGSDAGWYKSTPSPLDFSLCNWKKCPVRKIKLMIHTKDQHEAEGRIKFLIQYSEKEKVRLDRKLHCEIK